MAVTVDSFLDRFPEFASTSVLTIESLLTEVQIGQNSYQGIKDESVQDLVVSLHTAHLLTLGTELGVSRVTGARVKRVESKNDEIEYHNPGVNPYGFNQTEYGQRLEDVLNSCFISADVTYPFALV